MTNDRFLLSKRGVLASIFYILHSIFSVGLLLFLTSLAAADESDDLYFGKLIVSKTTAYVGEDLPIELRFYFDRHIGFHAYPMGQLPQIDGDNFVTKKYPAPSADMISIDDRVYRVSIYRTAISGVKPGILNLPSAYQEFLLQIPVNNSPSKDLSDSRSTQLKDFYVQSKNVKVRTNGITLTIKPLPTEGRPTGFSGAIGHFKMTSSISPNRAQVGDPIQLNVDIKGTGNFERMTSPTIVDTGSWRLYDPRSKLEPLDNLGISAVKKFSYTLVAESPVNKTPTVQFSYFDPEAHQYVTLTSNPGAIQIEGSPATLAELNGAHSQSIASAKTPVIDVLDIKPAPSKNKTFLTLFDNQHFWILQSVPAFGLALFGIGIWFHSIWKARVPLRPWIQEQRSLRQTIDSVDSKEFFIAATRLLALDVLIRSGGKLKQLTSEEALSFKSIPDTLKCDLIKMLETRDRLAYGDVRADPISENERGRMKQMVTEFGKATIVKSLLLLPLFGILLGLPAYAGDVWNEANHAYSSGHFEQAKVNYIQLIETGHCNANLFYNLGDTWFKLGDKGRAILNFRRALILQPNFPEARTNLETMLRAAGTEDNRTLRDIFGEYANFWPILISIGFWGALYLATY
jgi:hypothetical protein